MIEFVKIAVIYIILLYTCYLCGITTLKIAKYPGNAGTAVLIGFFALLALFQFVALPFILCKQSLTALTVTWNVIWSVLLIVLTICNRRELILKSKKKEKVTVGNTFLVLAIFVLIGFQIIMQIGHNYWAWDTAYYIGTVNTSLETDTMYLYEGTTGLLEKELHLRYALSSFYMLIAVICKTFSLHPILYFRYIAGILCIIFTNIIAFEIGKELFSKEKIKQKLFLVVYIVLNFLWVSDYSNAEFLMKRGYESKGYCANVVIPMIFLLGLLLLRRTNTERKNVWKMMFVVCLASVPVSMSSLAIVPVMVFVLTATCLLLDKDWKSVGMGIVCVLPNMIYAGLYLLYAREILVIGV